MSRKKRGQVATKEQMKFSEDEIIKALEWLDNTKGVCSSDDEYVYGQIIQDLIARKNAELADLNNLLKLSIDIQNEFSEKIDEQKVEIEKLKQNLKEAHIDIKEHMAKNERLHEVINGFEEQSHEEFLDYMELSEKYLNIKDVVERLEDKLYGYEKTKHEVLRQFTRKVRNELELLRPVHFLNTFQETMQITEVARLVDHLLHNVCMEVIYSILQKETVEEMTEEENKI